MSRRRIRITLPHPTVKTLAACILACALQGCGNPHNPDIVFKKMTLEEFKQLPPEEQETPEVMENMGENWLDPNDPKTAPNPKRHLRSARNQG